MEIRAVKFRVGSEWRVGGLFCPKEGETNAGVLMLHGFPGVQQNEDIAAELCRRGITAFLPHFRGSWGSSGRFTVHGIFEDARAALRLLSRYHSVDSSRIAILGHSVGGWVALKLASEARVAAVAVMAPAVPQEGVGDLDYLRRNAKVLNIPKPADVWEEYCAAGRTEKPEEYIRRIAPTPLLFLQGLQDTVVPPASAAKLYAAARMPKEWVEFPGENHDFEGDRGSVVQTVCRWIEDRLLEVPPSRTPAMSGAAEGSSEFVDIGGGD